MAGGKRKSVDKIDSAREMLIRSKGEFDDTKDKIEKKRVRRDLLDRKMCATAVPEKMDATQLGRAF
ncbi:uncharacterized protein G2W53_035295 [Senna tora]|uniref:Uncharacterized protein n=1 Tax=Senna tora TaxID=362788 RepID=A0A834W3U9_9FABA|nr:uncharacterized protein G2W53_035295 [Senna tora]